MNNNKLTSREIRARRKGGSIVHVMELTEDVDKLRTGLSCAGLR